MSILLLANAGPEPSLRMPNGSSLVYDELSVALAALCHVSSMG